MLHDEALELRKEGR